MEFFRRAHGIPARLGIFPGTFNPVTIAHLALAHAALALVDEVLFVLPRVFPHKTWSGAGFEERVDVLNLALAGEPAFSIAATDRGLFLEIAEECRAVYGNATRQSFLSGRDAAERILSWDYGDPSTVRSMLCRFDLLVADRTGEYCPPAEFAAAVRRLPLPAEFDAVSATEVRERIARGDAWEHLVPDRARERVREIYLSL